MKMQDNEFDKLFSSKLNNFEVEPSADVWERVSLELNTDKRKKILVPILGIAATILVLVVSGILFIHQKTNNGYQRKSETAKTILPLHIQPAMTSIAKLTVSNSQYAKRNHKALTNNKYLAKALKYIPVKSAQIIVDSLPAKTGRQSFIASLQQRQQNETKAVVPDERTQIAIRQPIEKTTTLISTPGLVATEIPTVAKQDVITAKSKHKIRSLGDLINVVVAKVDKRKDKIIEFTDTDDESNITGVNLGIIKFKKDQ
jgi:hypothetical protein